MNCSIDCLCSNVSVLIGPEGFCSRKRDKQEVCKNIVCISKVTGEFFGAFYINSK